MTVALWIIAICEVGRLLQNFVQIRSIQRNENGYDRVFKEKNMDKRNYESESIIDRIRKNNNYCDGSETYIIAFCPDTDSFFVTDKRGFYYNFSLEFDNEFRGICFFERHIFEFVAIRNQIMKKCGQKEKNRIFLENTKMNYEWN